MTGRLLTIAAAMTLSVSLAYGGQVRQSAPQGGGQSTGSQSSGGGQSAGSSSAGGQSVVGRSSIGGRSASGQSAGQQGSGRQAAPRSVSRPMGTPSPATARQESRGLVSGSQAAPPPTAEGSAQAVPHTPLPPVMRYSPFYESGRTAVPRVPPSPPGALTPPMSAFGPPRPPSGADVRASAPDGGQRFAQPRQGVPGPGDRSRNAGVAAPRGSVRPGQRPPSYEARYTSRLESHHHHYKYPRHVYPYGYGAFGLGYFYYDPYAWYPGSSDPGLAYPSNGYYAYRNGYPTGEIRLQVRRWEAEVYVDGYYAGRVDEFDGVFETLRVEEGRHIIEVVAPGYETLVFDVWVRAGRKIELRGELLPYR